MSAYEYFAPGRQRRNRDSRRFFLCILASSYFEAASESDLDLGAGIEGPHRCESAWGPGADRHAKLLIHTAVEGALLDAYSQVVIVMLMSPDAGPSPAQKTRRFLGRGG
jgi:hypothetical protein